MGKVVAIVKSPNREKEHLVTLMAVEKLEEEDLKKINKKNAA